MLFADIIKHLYTQCRLGNDQNYTRHLKHLERISGLYLYTNLHFRGLTFGRKIKSVESSSNMKFTHIVD